MQKKRQDQTPVDDGDAREAELTGKNVDITEPFVKPGNGPSGVVPLSLVQPGQVVVGVLLDVRSVQVEGQVLQLRVIPDDDLQSGGNTVVASKVGDDGSVVGYSEDLLVSGSVGTEDERVDVVVGEVDAEVVLGLVEEGGRAEGGHVRGGVHRGRGVGHHGGSIGHKKRGVAARGKT